MGNPIQVAIVDDDERCRQTVRGWFDETDDITIVDETPGGQEMLCRLRDMRPDVVLIDASLARAEQVRQVAAYAGVIVLHVGGQEALVLDALRAGALGHLDKQTTRPAQAVAAVRTVGQGEAVLSPVLAGRIVDKVAERHRRSDK